MSAVLHDLELAIKAGLRSRNGVDVHVAQAAADEIGRLLDVEEQARRWEIGGVRRDAGERSDLPCPRLQLRWASPEECFYELVIPVGEWDIRRERGDEPKLSRHLAIPMGHTTRGTTREPLISNRDTGTVEVDTPYRDGSHAAWDSAELGLPAYAVWQERATLIPPRVRAADGEGAP